ncbi:MAG: phosphatase domain-containing protein [Planctomycetota bacterium]|jgi:atypical dual specificity phosphatase
MSLHGFSWVIEGQLAAMSMPDRSSHDVGQLEKWGVGALVNLTRWDWPTSVLTQCGLEYLQLPIPDFSPPQPAQADEFVEFCDRNINQGRAVAVHCLAGKGRTGTMTACYLVHRGAEPQEAIDRIRSLRPGSIETHSQELAVHRFAARDRSSTS